MTEGLFYVYEHWRPDRDECFYVGKGTARRATVMYNRNRRHQEIQRLLAAQGMCVEIRMVAEGLDETSAFGLECERISFWIGSGITLCNLTAGGEGGSDPSEETRALMRARKLGGKHTEEHKRKIGEGSRRALADPAVKKRLSEAIKLASARPEVKAKRSASQKARIRPPEHAARISAALTGRKLSPEHREKARKASLGRKQTQEEIERRRSANTGKKRSAEFGERMKAMWTPERKAALAEVMKERSKKMNEQKALMNKYFPQVRGK